MLQAHLFRCSAIVLLIDSSTDGRTGLCSLIAACLLQWLACAISAASLHNLPKGKACIRPRNLYLAPNLLLLAHSAFHIKLMGPLAGRQQTLQC